MGSGLGPKQHVGTIDDFSSSGNPIVHKKSWDKRIVVVTDNAGQFDKGDTIKFTVQSDNGDHYQCSRVGEGKSTVRKPNYSGSPNVSIHHDGKHGESVADTRDEKETFSSPEEREFDPTTHGAPSLSREKPKRKFLRQD